MRLQVLKLIIFIFFALYANPLWANICRGSLKPPVFLWYQGYWSGMKVGDLVAYANEDNVDVVIESSGFVRWLSKYSSRTKVKLSNTNQSCLSANYNSFFTVKGKAGTVDLTYRNNNIISEVVDPPDVLGKRSKVSKKLKRVSINPVIAFFTLTNEIKSHASEEGFKITKLVYDGKRLFSLKAVIMGKVNKTIKGRYYKLVKVQLIRSPLAGFTKGELEDMKGKEPVVTLYFSDDERFVPIKIDAEAKLGTAVLLLNDECQDSSCMPYAKF